MRFAPFLPAAALLAIWVAWIPADGGYFPRDWFPAALFAVALLAAVVVAGGRALPPGRWARASLALLAAVTAWNFTSMLWAEADGRAWQSSDQLLLYLAMAWLVALVPWRPGSALGYMGVWSLAVAVACAGELISALSASDLGHYVLESRWQQPTGYANGAAAIAAMGAWPALVIAARRGVPAPLQVAMTIVAVFLLEMSVLPQSRAALIACAIVLPLLLVLSPDRGRLLGRLAVVALAFVVAGDAVWDVYGEGEAGRPLAPALDRAAEEILLSLALAALAAAVMVVAERRIRGPSLPRVPARARWPVLAAVVAGVAVAGLATAGSVSDRVSERWEEFKSEEQDEAPDENASRIAQSNGDKRYDYWRVSLNALADAPVGGVGAGGFEREYTEHRRYPKPSQAAHSIWFRALSETGVVGAALLALLVAALGAGLARTWRLGESARAAAAAAAAAGAYFVLHASLDWLELFPALAAPALGFALAAIVAGAKPVERKRPRRVVPLVAVPAAALALASLAFPYLSLRLVEAGRELDRAADLNPLSPEPHLVRGRLALGRADFPAAERAFRRALEEEEGWYPHFELALLASRDGRRAEARREIEIAERLNPPDPLVQRAAELIADGKRTDPRGVDRRKVEIRVYNDPRGH